MLFTHPLYHRIITISLVLLAALLGSCARPAAAPPPAATGTPSALPIFASAPATAAPPASPTPSLPADWTPLAPGVEGRSMPIPPTADDIGPLAALVLRIDPAQVIIRVHYDPLQPATVGEWQARTGAPILINAGFFRDDYTVAGLLVSGGAVYGTSFDQINAPGYESGGMFAVSSGALDIRSTEVFPYLSGEPLDEAVQGLPLLLGDGLPMNFDLPPRPARRTVVALDVSGRLLLIAVTEGALTLTSLRDWLTASDLSVSSALNLDGGTSTGLSLRLGGWSLLSDSYTRVSSVLAVYP